MLKLFLFLLISQVFVLERFLLLEYHIFGYLIVDCNYQNHVDNNIILGCSCCYLFPEHGLSCIFMKVIIDFTLNEIVDEAVAND